MTDAWNELQFQALRATLDSFGSQVGFQTTEVILERAKQFAAFISEGAEQPTEEE